LASAIESSIPGATVELIEGGRGDFIVKRGDDVLWDKRNDQGRFPEDAEILALLR